MELCNLLRYELPVRRYWSQEDSTGTRTFTNVLILQSRPTLLQACLFFVCFWMYLTFLFPQLCTVSYGKVKLVLKHNRFEPLANDSILLFWLLFISLFPCTSVQVFCWEHIPWCDPASPAGRQDPEMSALCSRWDRRRAHYRGHPQQISGMPAITTFSPKFLIWLGQCKNNWWWERRFIYVHIQYFFSTAVSKCPTALMKKTNR